LVFVAEIVNTAIEHIADFLSPERDERIRRIKDLGAAAVAVVIGAIVFLPGILAVL
jgi:diacylglycerol kinase